MPVVTGPQFFFNLYSLYKTVPHEKYRYGTQCIRHTGHRKCFFREKKACKFCDFVKLA